MVPVLFAVTAAVVVVVASLAGLLGTVRELGSSAAEQRRASEWSRSALEVERAVVALEAWARTETVVRGRVDADVSAAAHAELARRADAMVETAAPAQRAGADAVRQMVEAYFLSHVTRLLARQSTMTRAEALRSAGQGTERLNAIHRRLVELERGQQAQMQARAAHATRLRTRLVTVATAGAAGAVVLLLAFALGVWRLVVLPIRGVATSARELAEGRLDVRAPATGPGEVGRLGESFNAMATALQARERDLHVQTDRLHGLLEHTSATVSLKDLDGRYVLVNRKWREAAQLTEAEVIGRTDADIFPAELAAEVLASDRATALAEGPVEFEREIADGPSFRMVKFALRDRDGTVYGIASMGTDVTELKRVAAEAVAASESKSDFLANMSHEIRTPLNGVIGMTELLLQTELTPLQRDYASTAGTAGETLLRVVNDILDFSKVEAGKLELEHHDFDLRTAVEDACELLAPQAHARGLNLQLWFDDTVPGQVNGDRGRLTQVLINLLSNAVKFTHAGEVVVRVSRAGGKVRFAVSDTGIGIEPEVQLRVFDAFTQAESSTTRRYGGTGLGLAISHRLVELMGGALGVQSTPGTGSTFSFAVRFGAASTLPDAPVRLDPATRVLVVAANVTSRAILEQHVRSTGAQVDAASSLADASGYDAVVLDARLWAQAEGLPVPVVPVQAPARRRRLLAALRDALTGAAPAPGPRRAPAESEERSELILVVEDNAVNQRVIEAMLTQRGHTVEIAENGRVALEMLAERDYALVFMDCQMPELDGYAATEAIRAGEGPARCRPIVAMTANAIRGDRERCLAAGMDDYLSKPLRAEALDAALARWLPGPQTPEPAPIEALIDDARVQLLRTQFGDSFDEFVDIFASSTPPILADLRAAAAAQDEEAVRRAAHSLKGACVNLGAEALAGRALAVERARRATTAELDALDALFAQTCAELVTP